MSIKVINKLVKLDSDGQVDNRAAKNEPILKNINSYAVNGAVHYVILHHTSYTDIIAIGMTGHANNKIAATKIATSKNN